MFARHAAYSLVLLAAAAPALMAQQTSEVEPNNAVATATPAHLGDTLIGAIGYREYDFFAMDLPAGAKIEFVMLQHGFCAAMSIVDRDGQHGGGTWCGAERSPRDSVYFTATAGRYYVSITHDEETPADESHPPLPYQMRVALYTAPALGPGNPMRQFASTDNPMTAMVAALNGDMLFADRGTDQEGHEANRLRRVTPDGQVTTFATGVAPSGQIALDAFGDLLVPSYDQSGIVWRYDLAIGVRSIFTGPPGAGGDSPYSGVAIGADGDVWLSQEGSAGTTFFRFDALGVPRGSVVVPFRTSGLTMSQGGELFFLVAWSGDVYKLVNNTTPQRVITGPSEASGYGNRSPGLGWVSLDQDGWVYVIQPRQGKLLLFNAQYQLARDPLAQILDSLHWADKHIVDLGSVWMRDANGAMTSRMFVARGQRFYDEIQGPDEILEVNHAAMGAPGADPGLHLDRTSLRQGGKNTAYADTLRLAGNGSATWTVVSGQLPTGVTLSGSGALSGTPTAAGTSEFAVRAAIGARAGFGRFSITVGNAPPVEASVNDIANALMGGVALSSATVQYLDEFGNKNGRLDVGDFRAYLRSQGLLSGAPKP